jgi:hypothetical protein
VCVCVCVCGIRDTAIVDCYTYIKTHTHARTHLQEGVFPRRPARRHINPLCHTHSTTEEPHMPQWSVQGALQCAVHPLCVESNQAVAEKGVDCVEYDT